MNKYEVTGADAKDMLSVDKGFPENAHRMFIFEEQLEGGNTSRTEDKSNSAPKVEFPAGIMSIFIYFFKKLHVLTKHLNAMLSKQKDLN